MLYATEDFAMVTHSLRSTSASEDKDLGIGGRPPVDQRPTGGGGGDGDDGDGGLSPHPLLDRMRIVMAFALTADMLFLIASMAAFLLRHRENAALLPLASETWHLASLPPLLFLNAAVLLASCLTVEVARRQIFREIDVMEEWLGLGKPALRRTLPWLAATLLLGSFFLAGQALLWKSIDNPALPFALWRIRLAEAFAWAAGVHAAHLALGIIALLASLFALRALKRVELRQVAVDAAAWYWHAMGVAWLLLLTMTALDH
jgi:cytochrome c oxidase subunit 3